MQYNGFHYYGQPYPQRHQPVYPQQQHPPATPYTPYYPTLGIPQGPPPVAFDAEAYHREAQQASAAAAAASKRNKHRYTKTLGVIPQSTPAQPLKPALKKTHTVHAVPVPADAAPLSRQRTNSLHRVRTYSNGRPSGLDRDSRDEALLTRHLSVSFHGYNELRLGSVTGLALKELSNEIWPMWPGSVDTRIISESATAVVRFQDDPWDMAGPHVLIAYDMIVKLFTLCALRGYSYQTSIDTASSSPQLLFQPVASDSHSNFFIAYLTEGGRKFNMVKAPDLITLGISSKLIEVLPKDVALDVGTEDNHLRTLEVKKGRGSANVSPNLFLMHILHIISNFGYSLDASIPLSRRGAFGIRARREIFMFKGTTPQ